jgi:hypothetical protein
MPLRKLAFRGTDLTYCGHSAVICTDCFLLGSPIWWTFPRTMTIAPCRSAVIEEPVWRAGSLPGEPFSTPWS